MRMHTMRQIAQKDSFKSLKFFENLKRSHNIISQVDDIIISILQSFRCIYTALHTWNMMEWAKKKVAAKIASNTKTVI